MNLEVVLSDPCEDVRMNEPVKGLSDSDIERYLTEVTIQAESMRLSIASYNAAVNAHGTAANTALRVIAAAQGIINAAMAVTRLLWASPASTDRKGIPLEGQAERQRQWTLARARTLRELVGGINEQTSPLGARKVRNSFEHFDEYLDGFLFDIKEGRRPNVILDMAVVPRNSIDHDGAPPTFLRLVDNDLNEVWVLDESLAIQPLVNEVERIERIAIDWLTEHGAPGYAAAARMPAPMPMPSQARTHSMYSGPMSWRATPPPPLPPFPDRPGGR
jgi:hypothetical protein